MLQGLANSGKTTAIKAFRIELINRGAVDKRKIPCGKKDVTTIMLYRGCTVGLTSLGDSPIELSRLFSEARECDLCICACRTQGSTVDLIRKEAGTDDCVIVPKWKEDGAERNQHTIQFLLSLTDWLIDRHYYEKQMKNREGFTL